jgi:solute carrier family 25 folate transporter 32
MTASVATYPHEVVRTRLQTQRRLLLPSGVPRKRSGIIRTTRKIIHFEGWRGLYKGLSVNLIRTVPNSAVTMLTCVSAFRCAHRFFFIYLFIGPSTDTNC